MRPTVKATTFNPHTGLPTTLRQDDRENILGFFAQDDFKLRPNLTLNLGLRWSYFGPLSSKENNMYVAHPGAGANYLTGLTVSKGDSWNAQKNNFGPEIGFAWSPTRFNNRLVFRGGYGLNYNQEEIAISANITSNPGLSIGEYLSMADTDLAESRHCLWHFVESAQHLWLCGKHELHLELWTERTAHKRFGRCGHLPR